MANFKISVVPHTHWDKEWYFTKQDSDVVLVENINKFLKLYQSNPDCYSFTYDGQASVIDDYLTYYPNSNHELLTKSLKDKKLIIGPWYSQPDFFNSTSESLVRNLLIGINTAKNYHADYLKVAYVPDSFGHNSQMPQIYQQFGLKNFIYWRGARPQHLTPATVHLWEGIDGSQVLAYNFYLGYWVMGMYFPYQNLTNNNIKSQAQDFLIKFQPILQILKTKITKVSNHLLLPLGGDQAPVTNLLQEFIMAVNEIDQENDWEVTDYDSYFAKNSFNNLKKVVGELKSPAYARIHKTIGSQRADLKVKIKKIEYSLFNRLEPLATYYHLIGGQYPSAIITRILKLLTTSQAHDSLGGCNSDITNQDINNRLNQAHDLIQTTITKILKIIVTNYQISNSEFIIFNPTVNEKQQTKVKEATLFTKAKHFDIYDQKGNKINYLVVKQVYNSGGHNVVVGQDGEQSLARDGFYSNEIILLNLNLIPFAVTKFKIDNLTNIESSYNLLKANDVVTKKWLISINTNGTLKIYDKINNLTYDNQFKLFADHDHGDSYDYSPETNEQTTINKLVSSSYEISHYQNYFIINLKNTYQIPDKINGQFVSQDFCLNFHVTDEDEIKINVSTNNQATEIRWRIAAKVNFLAQYSYANQAYSTIARPVELTADLANWEKQNWKEKPLAIETNESFVYLVNDEIKSGFITRGNNEYEVTNGEHSTLYLTLFRSVPYLGRDNLLIRPGRASGVNELLVDTNDAKLLKPLQFQIYWFSTKQNNLWNYAEKLNTDVIFYQNQNLNSIYHHGDHFLIPEISELNVKQDILLPIIWPEAFTIKAIKKLENGITFMIRGFNNSEADITIDFTKLALVATVNSLDLLENKKYENLKSDVVKKYQIKTYEIIYKFKGVNK